jgi:hypothetical protein
MHDAEELVKHERIGGADRFDLVMDAYNFASNVRNGRVKKVVVFYQPGVGYRTIIYIDGKSPMERMYPDGKWGQAKADVDRTLHKYQCDLLTVKDPGQP